MAALDLTLSPAQNEIVLAPNSTYTQAYDISNNSSESVLLTSLVSSWIPANNRGNIIYLQDNDPTIQFSLSNSDLKLNQDFVLAPGQKRQLVLKIKNLNSDENDHFYTFFIQQKPLNPSLTDKQNLAKIGSHLLISSSNQSNSPTALKFTNLRLSPKFKDIFLPLKINGEIFNDAPHYSLINGQITVYYHHQNIKQLTLFPYTVLPQNSRLLECLDSNNEATICQLPAPLWPGEYQIKFSLNQNGSSQDYNQTFYVLPYSFIALILFIFLLLFLTLKNKQSISSNKI
jgi:hypothetical protein